MSLAIALQSPLLLQLFLAPALAAGMMLAASMTASDPSSGFPASLFSDTRRAATRRIFAWVAGCLALLRLRWAVAQYAAPDDWLTLHDSLHRAGLFNHLVADGRFVYAGLFRVLEALGVQPAHSQTTLWIATVFLSTVCAVLLAELWETGELVVASVIAGLLLFVHPFQSEIWSFHFVPFFEALGLAFALFGLCLARISSVWRIVAGAVLIAASLAMYQLLINYCAVAVCAGAMLTILRNADRQSGWKPVLAWLRPASAVALSVPVYLLANKVALGLLRVPPSDRSRFLPLSQAGERWTQVRTLLHALAGPEDRIIPWSLKLILFVLLITLIAAGWRTAWVRASLLRLGVLAALLASAVLCTIGVALPLASWWPTMRLLSAASLVWAAAAVGVSVWPWPRWRPVGFLLAGVIVFGFSGINDHMLQDEMRVNRRDVLEVNRIADRIGRLPGQQGVRRLALIHHRYGSPDIATGQMDLNLSSLSIGWAWSDLYSEVVDEPISGATPAETAAATKLCGASPRWPAEGSVQIQGEVAIVCF